MCVCDLKSLSSGAVGVVHALQIWRKKTKFVNTVIYEMQLASGKKKKSVQQRCASIGNQYCTRMMIPTCNKLCWLWTSSRLLFCSVKLFFSLGDRRMFDESRISEHQTRLSMWSWKYLKKIQGWIFSGVFLCFFFPRCSQFLMRDQVNITKALKSNSALCVTSRPPCLILCERLQQKELLE